MRQFSILIIFISYTFGSCSKEGENQRNVYLAGELQITTSDLHPVYWRNGTRKDMSNGSSGYLNDISVSGSHIYLAGGLDKAAYWTDDQAHVLNDSLAFAFAITTFQNDVFVAGSMFTGKATVATCWKNGVLQFSAPDTSGNSNAYSIAISGGDIYLAGRKSKKTTYWKNGNEVSLAGDSYLGVGNVIAISDGDVYVAGNIFDAGSGNQAAGYWKNGQWVALTDTTGYAETNGIAVSGNDVYVAGSTYKAGVHSTVYWKNGQVKALSTHGEAVAIKVRGTDVYVAGTLLGGGGYWKNGTWVPVSSLGGQVKVTAIDVE